MSRLLPDCHLAVPIHISASTDSRYQLMLDNQANVETLTLRRDRKQPTRALAGCSTLLPTGTDGQAVDVMQLHRHVKRSPRPQPQPRGRHLLPRAPAPRLP